MKEVNGKTRRSWSISFIFSNIILLFGVFSLGWNVVQIIIFLWLEFMIIGLYYALFGFLSKGPVYVRERKGTKTDIFILITLFFVLFGGVYGAALFLIFDTSSFAFHSMLPGILSLLVSYGLYFLYLGPSLGGIPDNSRHPLVSAYQKLMVLILTTVIGGAAIKDSGQNSDTLAFVIIVKIIADFWSTAYVHRKMRRG